MAVRSQHVHDGGISERRLRPIYDWLDTGNNKKALQEAEKVLKKSPALQTARALKALSLLRLGKTLEAETILDALAAETPSDDGTLQVMSMSYKETQQMQKVCSLYEAAVKADACNEELHSHLFMSYVRVNDYKSQQRAAMALYKFSPKNPYYFWAVMSIVLQAKTTNDPKQKNILLTLAQRMIDLFIRENKIESEQEVRLYVMILEIQEKWSEIVEFMEGPLYTKLVPGSMPQGIIPYLKHLKQWRKLNLLCKELLLDNQDRWDYYLPYLESVFELIKSPSDSEDTADDTAEKCHEFICQILESVPSGKHFRGPYLARLELWKRLSKEGDATVLLGSATALCLQYLRIFAHKPCAVPDLKPYLAMIEKEEREKNCREFLICLGFNENSEPKTSDDVQRHLSCVYVWQICSPPDNDHAKLATLFKKHYLRSLQSGLVTSTITEFCAADGYAVFAAHQYFYAAVSKGSSSEILEALCLLELVLYKSPANFHVKLLLVVFYHLLGNALAADTIYHKLEIKHVQVLSLGWIHAARLGPEAAVSRALQLHADTCAFHDHQAKDTVEQLTYSYKFGTFEKLVELIAWGERLNGCAWAATSGRDRPLLVLLGGPTTKLPTHCVLPDRLTDNRDINVIVNWEAPSESSALRRERTFDQDVAYLRIKDGLSSAITLCVELADHSRTTEEKKNFYSELTKCTESLCIALDKCKERFQPEPLTISMPFPSRIIALVNSQVPYRELYPRLFRGIADITLGHGLCELNDLDTRLKLVTLERPAGNDLLASLRQFLEDIVNYLEYLAVTVYLVGLCYDNVHGPKETTKKSKKKGQNHSTGDLNTLKLLNQFNLTLQNCLTNLEEIFEEISNYKIELNIETELSQLNLVEGFTNPVESKLKDGYSEMCTEIKYIIKRKIKDLKSLNQ